MADRDSIDSGMEKREYTVEDFIGMLKQIKLLVLIVAFTVVIYSCSVQAQLSALKAMLQKAIGGP